MFSLCMTTEIGSVAFILQVKKQQKKLLWQIVASAFISETVELQRQR